MWKNYINSKALHKERSYDLTYSFTKCISKKAKQTPPNFPLSGLFLFCDFPSLKMKLEKKKKKPSAAAIYMAVYKSQDEIEITIAQGPKFTFSEGGWELEALMTLGRAAEITNSSLALTSLCSFKWSNQPCFSKTQINKNWHYIGQQYGMPRAIRTSWVYAPSGLWRRQPCTALWGQMSMWLLNTHVPGQWFPTPWAKQTSFRWLWGSICYNSHVNRLAEYWLPDICRLNFQVCLHLLEALFFRYFPN